MEGSILFSGLLLSVSYPLARSPLFYISMWFLPDLEFYGSPCMFADFVHIRNFKGENGGHNVLNKAASYPELQMGGVISTSSPNKYSYRP